MSQRIIWVYICVVLAMIMWSLTFVWFKIVNEVLPPFTIVFLRLLAGSIIMLVISWIAGVLQKVKGRDLINFLILATFYPFIYFIAESQALTMISASFASVMISLIPLLVPIGASILFRERLSPLNIVGVVVSFSGVLVLAMKPDFSLNAAPLGILLMCIAVIAGIVYTLMVKKMTEKFSAFTITTYQNLFGTLFFLPLFLIFDANDFTLSEMTPKVTLNLGYLVIFGTILAYIFFNYSIKVLGAARTELFANMIPVLTAVFAFFLLGEALGFQKIIGIAIVISGLFLSQIRSRKRASRHFAAP